MTVIGEIAGYLTYNFLSTYRTTEEMHLSGYECNQSSSL